MKRLQFASISCFLFVIADKDLKETGLDIADSGIFPASHPWLVGAGAILAIISLIRGFIKKN